MDNKEGICKDFRRNQCSRGESACKFRHVAADEGDEDDNECKDFKRKVCFRGNTCRFQHPGDDKNTKMKLTFCGNFQRSRCHMEKCQYVHADKTVETKYLKTGWLPDELRQTVIEHFGLCMRYLRGDCTEANCEIGKHTNLQLEIPDEALFTHYYIFKQSGLCKEYLEGRHLKDQRCSIAMKHCSPEDVGLGNLTWQEVRSKMDVCGGAYFGSGARKRARMENGEMDMMGGMGAGNGGVSLQEFSMLQRENRALRIQVDQLKAQLSGCACRAACMCPPPQANANVFW